MATQEDEINKTQEGEAPSVTLDKLEEDLGPSQGLPVEGSDDVEDSDDKDKASAEALQKRIESATAGYDSQLTGLDKIISHLKEPRTKEERERQERKERSRRLIAGVSDGLSALSNIFFTDRYAPNMYNHNTSQSKTVDARIERLKAEREKQEQAYLNYALKRGDIENRRAATVREIEQQAERQRLAEEAAKAKAERDSLYLQWLQSRNEGQQADNRKKGADADTAEIKRDNQQQQFDDKHAESQSRINKNNRSGGGRSSGGGKSSGKSGGADEVTVTETYDRNGNLKSTKKVTKNNGKGTPDNDKWSNTKKLLGK